MSADREAAFTHTCHSDGECPICHLQRELAAAREQNQRLRDALDQIEAAPEDAVSVQLWARNALAASGGQE